MILYDSVCVRKCKCWVFANKCRQTAFKYGQVFTSRKKPWFFTLFSTEPSSAGVQAVKLLKSRFPWGLQLWGHVERAQELQWLPSRVSCLYWEVWMDYETVYSNMRARPIDWKRCRTTPNDFASLSVAFWGWTRTLRCCCCTWTSVFSSRGCLQLLATTDLHWHSSAQI